MGSLSGGGLSGISKGSSGTASGNSHQHPWSGAGTSFEEGGITGALALIATCVGLPPKKVWRICFREHPPATLGCIHSGTSGPLASPRAHQEPSRSRRSAAGGAGPLAASSPATGGTSCSNGEVMLRASLPLGTVLSGLPSLASALLALWSGFTSWRAFCSWRNIGWNLFMRSLCMASCMARRLLRSSTMSLTVALFEPRRDKTTFMKSANESCSNSFPFMSTKMASALSTRLMTSTPTSFRALQAEAFSRMPTISAFVM
mmetsp:Transcript_93971/g.280486  ORF Transcript_93971/g.280486 Transcript_93971/m.280486 type:complete len:260 (+) Transcript_93971:712-1491(+)